MTGEADVLTHRILVIDDNASIHDDYRKILAGQEAGKMSDAEAALFGEQQPHIERPTFDVDSAMQGRDGVERARQALAEGRPYSVAFVDMRMPPGWDGLETIEHLWAVDPEVQVVVCSAYTDYDWLELLSRLGHSDKLIVVKKPFEPIEILQCASALSRKWANARALKQHVESLELVVTDRTRGLEAANRKLRHLASHDVLTGLPNRMLLDDRITQTIAQADRQSHAFAVLVIDLDRFKIINDSLGHRAGDELLREVAQRLKTAVRTVDTTARLGGDEFVILLGPPITESEGLAVARRVIQLMEPSMRLLGIDVHITPSIGMAYYPRDGRTADTLLAHADAAMYTAKERGRNNVQCYAAGMSAGTQDRVRLESELHAALRGGQFELHYQPKVDTATGRINSAEALIRWRHPLRGLLPPSDFIGIADDCGLLDDIGEWVLHEACRQAKAWQDAGLPRLRVAVNLAPSQFRLTNLVDQIRRALDAAALDPQLLEVELTESAVMSDAEESILILEAISSMGVLVSVDDFGTGYSSMSYLRRFPIDKLKIDRCFVEDMTRRPEDASIVRAIISLAHSLHLKVIAEGVESSEQLTLLAELGCDQYQGFFFSPALAADKFVALVKQSQANQPGEVDESERTHSKLAALGRAARG
ncbi:MAG TPA: EAL domain-containing protein [Steroidobacteraceae bacterium]|jgi:diguanylate cyclase (GGDEF)-like protein|nr:EAL domain-containing protein [Steroidobacteraceae bacterium]